MNILDLRRSLMPLRGWAMPSGDGEASQSGGSVGGGNGGWSSGSYGGYTTGSSENGREGESPAGNVGGYDAGYQSDRAAQDANGLADRLNAANPNNQVDSISALGAVTNNFGTTPADNRSVSQGGMTYGQVDSLSRAGYGGLEGVNANNTTQTVDQTLASRNFNDNIGPAIGGLVSSMVPGGALALSGIRSLQNDTYGSFFGGLVGGQLGVPMGSQFGAMAGNYAQTGIAPGLGDIGKTIGGYTLGQLGNEVAGPIGGLVGSKVGAMAGSSLGESTQSGSANAPSVGGYTEHQTGGWSSGGNSSGASQGAKPAEAAQAPVSAADTPAAAPYTSMRLNFDGKAWGNAVTRAANGYGG